MAGVIGKAQEQAAQALEAATAAVSLGAPAGKSRFLSSLEEDKGRHRSLAAPGRLAD